MENDKYMDCIGLSLCGGPCDDSCPAHRINDDDYYDEENAWLCPCGNFQADGNCHCSHCGGEAPWGCDCGLQEEIHGYPEDY